MIVYDKEEKVQADLLIKDLCLGKKPYEVRNYIDRMTPEELKAETNHSFDAYDFYISAYSAACREVFRNMEA